MDLRSKVWVAGHLGLVGSAICRNLVARGHSRILARSHAELDLTEQRQVEEFFARERPDYVFLAAAKVGGIRANTEFPAEFMRDNLSVQTNVLHSAWRHGVKRLLFLGSSCIYPRLAPQPIHESALLTDSLEPTNRPYAVAKIAGIEMCRSYNWQYGCRFLAAAPTNLYGPRDNYHPKNSHVIPALIRKFHEAARSGARSVVVWGTGRPRREFMFSDDMADACVTIMCLGDVAFDSLLGHHMAADSMPPMINIGTGEDLTIAELAALVSDVVGYRGAIEFDARQPDGTPRKLLDVSRLRKIGWTPKTDLRAGLQVTYADFLQASANNTLRK